MHLGFRHLIVLSRCDALLPQAFSTEAAARSSESASTSGRDSAKPADGKGTAKGKGAGAGGASAPAPSAAAAAAAAAAASSYLQPSRLGLYTRTILQRELMLKLQPRSWDALPRLTAIEVSIPAIETQLERDVVDKSELLLYALALEVLAGKPAGFTAPANKALGTRATGVAVRLDAVTEPEAAHLFMEKLVHVLLPNQVGVEGTGWRDGGWAVGLGRRESGEGGGAAQTRTGKRQAIGAWPRTRRAAARRNGP